MAGGRPRKPLSQTVKHYTAEEKEQKEREEQKLEEYKPLVKTPPNELKGEAKKEYNRVYKLLHELPLSELDRQVFIQYCELVGVTKDLKYEIELLKKQVKSTLESNALDIALDKQLTTKRNQLTAYYKEIKSHANIIGLTMESRMRLTPDSAGEPEDEFLKIFGEE